MNRLWPRTTLLGVGGTAAGGGITRALAIAGAPWWCIALLVLAAVLVIGALSIVRAVFPQDSHDRVMWWQERWRQRAEYSSGRRRQRAGSRK